MAGGIRVIIVFVVVSVVLCTWLARTGRFPAGAPRRFLFGWLVGIVGLMIIATLAFGQN